MVPKALVEDRRYLAQRAAKTIPCRKCGRPTLQGDDHDKAPGFAIVDPTPIDMLGEAAARLAGLKTYAIARRLGVPEICRRTALHTDRRNPVTAEHRCDIFWPDIETPATPVHRELGDDECPF
jgi:hypothetical protein